MAKVVGDLLVNLGLDPSAFNAGLKGATSSLKNAGRSLASIGQEMSLKVTAPIAGIGALALRAGADFEAAMNRIGAVTGANATELTALSDAAREMGRTTQFSATQAAEAVEILAKNGVSAADILGGALSASLQLAASGGTDLASAGDLATDIMLNFGKSAADLSGVVDGVAGVMVASKFGIEDYGLALAQAGGVAGGLGVELEDFNAVIAATSSLFASGSDAGTSFKTFLQRLVPASKPAAETMEALGLSFFDAQGNMRSMAEIAQQLQDGLSGLSEAARTEALSTIFGTDAMRTAIGLMDQGAEGIARLDAAIGAASATEQANARMEGFSGSVRKLQSAFEGLLLKISDSGLLDGLTAIVEGLTGITNRVAEADPRLVKFGVVFAGVAAAVGPVAVALGGVALVLGSLAAPLALAVTGVAALTAGVVAFWPEIVAAKDRLGEFWEGLRQSEGALGVVVDALEETIDWFRRLGSATVDIGREIVSGLVAGLSRDLGGVRSAIGNIGTLMNDYFGGLPGQFIEIGREIIEGLMAGLREKWESVRGWFTGLADSIPAWVRERLGIQSPSTVFAEIGRNIMQGLEGGVAAQTGPVEARFAEIADRLSATMSGVSLSSAQSRRSADELADDARRVYEETRTAQEQFAARIAELNGLVRAGALDMDTYQRAVVKAQDQFDTFADKGVSAFDRVAASFGDLASALLRGDSLGSALSGVLSGLGGSLVSSGTGALGALLKIPGFANGTHFAPGGLAVVGERGPELVNLPRGAQVTPNARMAMGGVTVNYAPVNDNRGASVEAVARIEAMQRQQAAEFEQTFHTRVWSALADRRNRRG